MLDVLAIAKNSGFMPFTPRHDAVAVHAFEASGSTSESRERKRERFDANHPLGGTTSQTREEIPSKRNGEFGQGFPVATGQRIRRRERVFKGENRCT